MKSLPPCLQRVLDLNEAIRSLNYEKVQEMLADEHVPVNVSKYHYIITLPLKQMICTKDPKMARLFLQCPRIDWLAPEWDRGMMKLEEEFGIQYERGDVGYFWTEKKRKSDFSYFYYLDESFVQACPEEAWQIYEKIIAELVAIAETENFDMLLLRTCKQLIPFQMALKYSTNINVKNENNETLLHLTNDLDVAKLLIEKGADVNAKNSDGRTPLNKTLETQPNVALVELLLKSGAEVGDCCFRKGFLSHFEVSKAALMVALSKEFACVDSDELEMFFGKYPQYKELFESDLPSHLCVLENSFYSDYCVRLSDEDYISFLKHMIIRSKGNYFGVRPSRTKLIEQHANELLYLSVRENSFVFARTLLEEFKADPNCICNGKAPLFVAHDKLIHLLLSNGADPFLELDGLKFFEREDFCQNETIIDAYWLINLARKGFDIFKPSEKTGKSLINYLNPTAQLSLGVNAQSYSFPLSKLSQLLFDVFCCNQPDVFAPIDEDGNTILHYAAQQCNFRYIGCVFDLKGVSELKQIRNKSGKSLFESFIENDKDCYFAKSITTLDDFKAYAGTFLEIHGVSFFKVFGAQFFYAVLIHRQKPDFEIAEYLLERGVSINRILDEYMLGHEILKHIFHRHTFHNYCEAVVNFVLKHGYRPIVSDLTLLVQFDHVEYVEPLIEECENIHSFINSICVNSDSQWNSEFNDAYRAFFSHPKVLESTKDGCKSLDIYFFAACSDDESIIKTEFFLQLGVDPRRLIGTETAARVTDGHFQGFALLLEAGWTLEDFKNIECISNYRNYCSLYDHFMATDANDEFSKALSFLLSIPTIRFDQIDSKEIIGDKDSCAICKQPFQADDQTILLECKHLFHADCSRAFLMRHLACPYCRNSISSPNLQ